MMELYVAVGVTATFWLLIVLERDCCSHSVRNGCTFVFSLAVSLQDLRRFQLIVNHFRVC